MYSTSILNNTRKDKSTDKKKNTTVIRIITITSIKK